jgi:ion channel-forming bestrophin family protein
LHLLYITMIAYNPKDWFSFVFKMHKADTFRHLFVMIICICLYTWGIAWLELEYWNLSKKTWVKEIHLFHGLLGFVLSLLLVFRTNTAYDRWWEGRKIWGSLVNASRNLALKINNYLPEGDTNNRKFFRKIIPLYAKALAGHLAKEKIRLELDDSAANLLMIDSTKHVPNQIAQQIFKKVQQLYQQKIITDAQLININQDITTFTDVCGACERIKNTPIPFSYSLFIKKFIFIYVMTLPFGFVFKLGYYVIPVVALVFYVLASLELIAEEIEDPFGNDVNDVPMLKIANNIDKSIQEII